MTAVNSRSHKMLCAIGLSTKSVFSLHRKTDNIKHCNNTKTCKVPNINVSFYHNYLFLLTKNV